MTAIVGMNLGGYVLLAADTRVTYYPGAGTTPVWRDDEEKILRTTMGIITGMGLVQLLDSVKEQLCDEDPLHTDRVIEIIRQERATIDRRWPHDPRVREAVEHVTCWMFSYVTGTDMAHPTPENTTLRLALSHPHQDYKLALYGSPQAIVGYPSGIEPEQAEPLTAYVNENLMPMNGWEEFEASVSHNARLAALVIRHLAEINDGVSGEFQVGIHSILHGAIVSELSRDGSLSFTLTAGGNDSP